MVTKATTKTRKKLKDSSRLTDQDRYQVVQRYMTTEDSTRSIAKEFSTTEKNVEMIVQRHWKALTNVRETKLMTQNQKSQFDHKDSCYHALKSIGRVPQINEDFLQLLSGPEEHLLTDNELQYCYNIVATGDSLKALESAGLNKGLLTAGSDKNRNQYRLACQLRGHYLRQKKNVAEYLIKLKEEQYIPEAIDKQFVQRELLEILHYQKEGGEPAEKKLRTIELLGKSVGAFSDVIKVEEIDPAKALDFIDSLAKADASASKDVIEIIE